MSSDPIGNHFAVKFVPDVLHCLNERVFIQVPWICLVRDIPQNCGDEVAAPAVSSWKPQGRSSFQNFLMFF
jgi:hypothetical protein